MAHSPVAESPPKRGAGGCPVLVVHGDEAARGLIVDALRSEGFRAVGSDHWDALAALDLLPGGSPRAVLVDLDGRDSRGGGVSALAAVLERRCRDVPIIGLSTSPGVHDGSAIGAAALLHEPFDLDDLFAAVDRFCQN